MATTSDFRNGLVIKLNDEIYTIVEFLHVKPGKGGAFVRTKLKKVTDGSVIDRTFRAGERVEDVRLEDREMEFLYRDNNLLYFMDCETYEQHPLTENQLGEGLKFLKENTVVTAKFHEGEPLLVELPFFVDLQIVDTDPGLRGDTASGGSKPAKLETGAVIQVPLFVKNGSTVRVDTRTGEYVERVSP
ncbi:TPA: elongation factor P [Candidatus Poribacteria bacterium]|nr:elongation factor P [Candidatus Poribacteria bacterium]